MHPEDAVASVSYHELAPNARTPANSLCANLFERHNPFLRSIVRRTRSYLETTIDPATGEPFLKPVAVELFGEEDPVFLIRLPRRRLPLRRRVLPASSQARPDGRILQDPPPQAYRQFNGGRVARPCERCSPNGIGSILNILLLKTTKTKSTTSTTKPLMTISMPLLLSYAC